MVTSYGIKSAENGITAVPRLYKPTGTKRALVVCHGYGELGVTSLTSAQRPVLQSAVESGLAAVETDLTGTAGWGSSAVQTAIGEAIAHAQSTLGGKADKVLLWGISMGGLGALNYLVNEGPSKVAALALTVPVVDLVYEHDNNVDGFAASIEAALGIAGAYAGNPAVTPFDPIQNTEAIAASGVPIKVWYASNDTIAITARQQAFIEAVGCESVNSGAVGHTYSAIPPGSLEAFLGQYA